jgi:hypothetical protein
MGGTCSSCWSLAARRLRGRVLNSARRCARRRSWVKLGRLSREAMSSKIRIALPRHGGPFQGEQVVDRRHRTTVAELDDGRFGCGRAVHRRETVALPSCRVPTPLRRPPGISGPTRRRRRRAGRGGRAVRAGGPGPRSRWSGRGSRGSASAGGSTPASGCSPETRHSTPPRPTACAPRRRASLMGPFWRLAPIPLPLRHSRESGNPGRRAPSARLEPRLRGGDG